VRVDAFDYHLPADRIAQEARLRGSSRLLVLDRGSGALAHRRFMDLPELLHPGDLLVRNDVRVRPARLYGRDAENRLVEIFLLRSVGEGRRRWLALAKPGRRARPGRCVVFDESVAAEVVGVAEDGVRTVLFDAPLDEGVLDRLGHTPLPPYIRRDAGAPDRPQDRAAYQTVFAREPLAVAAPTAGLHFTEEILARIRERGVEIADLTLAVGAAKASGRRVLAVGTTVARSLEGDARRPAADEPGDRRFATDLFITPGFEFWVLDGLLTNFHLPRSTLLMLVSAFAGRERVLAAYADAIREGYAFYSFGDAMFIA